MDDAGKGIQINKSAEGKVTAAEAVARAMLNPRGAGSVRCVFNLIRDSE